MNEGICIQIGLNETAEYLYLSEPDWKEKMRVIDPLEILPESLHQYTSWRYFGIDRDPASIILMMNKYPNRENIVWIQSFLHENVSTLEYTESWLNNFRRFLMFTMSFDMLVDALEIDSIDVLAIDIEGDEEILFNKYSWRLKPKYITVEAHENADTLHELVTGRGYVPFQRSEEAYRDTHYIHRQLQFLRADLC